MNSSLLHASHEAPRLHNAPPGTAEAARPKQLRQANCRALLRLLRESSPCSRADLVRSSGLSAPTVAAAVAQLAHAGLVESMGDGKSSGGRPPGLLRFNPSHAYVAGADIGGTHLRMMLADLDGRPVATWSSRLEAGRKTPAAVVQRMRDGLREMAAQAGAGDRVRHVTVGAPGITDVRQGVVKAAPNLESWNHVPLQAMVEAGLGVQAIAENDVNLAAVGERSHGIAKDASDFVFIAMGTGVGAGVYVGGALNHGANWSAGEIGYLPVAGMPRGPMLLEQTGQLERAIGGEGIELAWREALRRAGRNDAALAGLHASQVFNHAGEGDALAIGIVQATARILADAIGILALLYDPSLIVLGGGVGSHEGLRAATEMYLQANEVAQPALRISRLGSEAQLFGAIALSLAAVESDLVC